MIRGCIENVSPRAVSGWIHAEGMSLRDAPLLAFVGKDCIGAGQVGQYRQDLADAGLGDGYLGFKIEIAGERAHDLAAVVVRLESSDAVLVQPHARLVGHSAETPLMDPADVRDSVNRYRYMLTEGWIEQSDYDLMKGVARRGHHEQMLPRALRQADIKVNEAVQSFARRMLSLIHCRELTLAEHSAKTAEELATVLAQVRDADPLPLVVLCGTGLRLQVVDSGHLRDTVQTSTMMAEVSLAPHQMVFLDARASITVEDMPAGGVLVLTADQAK